ncbi:MAG: hypothetical protein LAO07_16240 [Acidobacteriia bacterium]|nr:hypothetical protein [Terriglobia bacterium]
MKRRTKSTKTSRRGEGLTAWRRMPRTDSRRGSRHLFDRWAGVSARLRGAEHVALFLDFDGTLVPLRHRPGDVWLNPVVRRAVESLARRRRVTVCLISGRRLADLRRRARIAGARYVGLHGWPVERCRSFSCISSAPSPRVWGNSLAFGRRTKDSASACIIAERERRRFGARAPFFRNA